MSHVTPSRSLLVALVAALVLPAAAAASRIVYVCGPQLCSVSPDGGGKRVLTKDGREAGPRYSSVSASRDGSVLVAQYGDDLHRLNGKGRHRRLLERRGRVPRVSPSGELVAFIRTRNFDPTVTTSDIPFLFLRHLTGSANPIVVARLTEQLGWLGGRLMRDTSNGSGRGTICLLAVNTAFECARAIAQDETRAVVSPAGSPNGKLVAGVLLEDGEETGDIGLFSAADGSLVRELTRGNRDFQPTFAPDGRAVAFARGRAVYTVPVGGGKARRVAQGRYPAWTR